MDHARDDDAALRSLGEDLARDDPRLAALLEGTAPLPPRRRGGTLFVLLLITPVLGTLALLVPPTVAVGALAILLAAASPVAVCWLCAADRPDPPPS